MFAPDRKPEKAAISVAGCLAALAALAVISVGTLAGVLSVLRLFGVL